MKKKTTISLIVAAALILCGGILIFLGLQSVDFDFSQEAAEKTYVVSDTFQSVQIDSDTCDVILVKTEGECRAVCPDTEKLSCAVLAEDGVLKVSAVDIRHWTDLIGVFPPEMRITVYLPESQYQTLRIETDTGDVTVPEDFSFENAELLSATGDIDFSAAATESLITGNSTGDTGIYGVCPAQLEVRSSTGDIELENIQVSRDIRLRSSTGKISAENVTCTNLTSQSNTGNAELENVLVKESLQITTTTGEVEIKDSDAGSVIIETDTGDVTGNFLSPKWFITETDTGDIEVPFGREGGECRITTDTGDIEFS